MGSGQSIALQTRVAVCVKHALGDTSSPVGQKPLKYWFLRLFTFFIEYRSWVCRFAHKSTVPIGKRR